MNLHQKNTFPSAKEKGTCPFCACLSSKKNIDPQSDIMQGILLRYEVSGNVVLLQQSECQH